MSLHNRKLFILLKFLLIYNANFLHPFIKILKKVYHFLLKIRELKDFTTSQTTNGGYRD